MESSQIRNPERDRRSTYDWEWGSSTRRWLGAKRSGDVNNTFLQFRQADCLRAPCTDDGLAWSRSPLPASWPYVGFHGRRVPCRQFAHGGFSAMTEKLMEC